MVKRLIQVLGRPLIALLTLAAVAVGVIACVTRPPPNTQSICAIFEAKPRWYRDARQSEQRWGTPVHVQMAIIKQESNFRHDAKPPRKRYLGFIPGGRGSSSYGYAQAQDATWADYKTANDAAGARRSRFDDSIDFVGWYTHQTQRRTGVSKWDPYQQYLAYHEGQGGFTRGTWRKKAWLLDVAKRVDATARDWGAELKRCQHRL